MSENMPVNVEIDNGIGSVTFEDDVIAIIAGLAATEVKGVASMAGSMSSSLNEMLGKKDHTKGVKVEVGTEEAAVDLYLSLYYGISIPETCRAVQENVKKAIETMTGLRVVEVNVTCRPSSSRRKPRPRSPRPRRRPLPGSSNFPEGK